MGVTSPLQALHHGTPHPGLQTSMRDAHTGVWLGSSAARHAGDGAQQRGLETVGLVQAGLAAFGRDQITTGRASASGCTPGDEGLPQEQGRWLRQPQRFRDCRAVDYSREGSVSAGCPWIRQINVG